jgi:cation diffusion facilitator CzcD-associated flavoprotein CzcO
LNVVQQGIRFTRATSPEAELGTAPRVIIVGAGFGGIGLAIGLREDGADVTVLEKQDGVGGTWRANTYPGAACDVPSHLYSFSFAPTADWSRVYAPQTEILAYLEQVVDDHDLRGCIRTEVEVVSARFDEPSCTWEVELSTNETLTCDVLVSATGQLSKPLIPSTPGLAAFPGPVLHSATWDHDALLDGVRVAVIGSGASAIQLLPPLAERASHLTLFQRTPPWVLSRLDRAFLPFERAAFRRIPGLRSVYRAGIWAWKEASWLAFLDGSPANALLRSMAEKRLRQMVVDPALREQLRPDFTPGCKRVLVSNDWYPALQRDDVTVLATGVERIEGSTVVGQDGSEVEVDAIVLGTGFRATDLLTPMQLTGRDGRDLHDAWSGGAEAFLGMSVHGFPNMFVLYGPNTNLSHNSIIHMLESQFAYVRDAVRRIVAGEADALDVRADVQARFNSTLDRRLDQLVWDSGCTSWYVTGEGRNTLNWPGLTSEYRLRTRRVRLDDHEVIRRTPTPPDAATRAVAADSLAEPRR